MTTPRSLHFACAAIVLAIVPFALSAEPDAAKAPPAASSDKPDRPVSNTRSASCLVKITCDPATFPLDNEEAIGFLLESTPVKGEAIRRVFGAQAEPGDFGITFTKLDARVTAPAAPVSPPSERLRSAYGGGGYGGHGGMMGGYGGGGYGGGYGGHGGGSGDDDDDDNDEQSGLAPLLDSPGQATLLGRIEVNLPDAGEPPIAEEFARAVCDRLRAALVSAHEGQLAPLQGQGMDAEHHAHETREHLNRLQQERQALCAKVDAHDLAREGILDRARQLDDQKQKLEMDLAAQQARRNAITEQIARIGKDAAEKTAEDPMLKPLQMKQKLLADKLARLREMQKERGVPLQEVQEAEVRLAETEAEILERQRQMREAAGGGGLGDFNNELATLSIQAAETEARLAFVNKQLIRTKDLLAAADDYEMGIALELPLAREAYERARRLTESLAGRLRLAQPPSVTVLGQD